MPDPNQTDLTKTAPSIFPQGDLPPLPPAFQSTPAVSPPTDQGSGSSAPPETPPLIPPSPKKKFGGGRIIATILGLLLLVGGIGAGIVLTGQQQLFQQKAGSACNALCLKNASYDECGCTGPASSHPDLGVIPARATRDDDGTSGTDGLVKGVPVSGGAGAEPASPTCVTNGNTCVPISRECTDAGGSVGGGTCTSGVCCTGLAGAGGCNPGDTQMCSQAGIKGVETCNSNRQWGSCDANPDACNISNPCANGYSCTGNVCVPNTNVDCGRSTDPSAPVCCSAGTTAASCSSAGGEPVCEAPKRSECKTTGANGTKWCLIQANSSVCGGSNPPGGGGGGPTGSCLNVKAYSATWTALTDAQLSALEPNNVVNFCVLGSATSGVFDKAQFKIGTTLESETTTKRPASQDFCQSYTIKSTDTTVNVKAKIHHATLGWMGEAI